MTAEWQWCRVYWGSHGCQFPRGHDGAHECDCCECDNHLRDHDEEGCVAKPPYYDGPDVPTTHFYGEDAVLLGLPRYSDALSGVSETHRTTEGK